MPYETHYVDSGNGLLKVGSGILTAAEMFEGALRLSLDERTKKLKYGLVDFSQTSDLRIDSELIRKVVEINRKTAQLTPGAAVAIIAPSPLAYGLSRVWQSLAYDLGWTANIFHTRPAATG